MVKLKQILAVAAAGLLLCLTGCGADDTGKDQEPVKQQAETMDMLTFTAQMDGGSVELTYWGDGERTYYFFLPSGCTPGQLAVTTRNGITLRKDGEEESARVPFANGETFEGIECNTTYLLGCYDQNNYIYELPVVFMQGENIHSVFITTQSGSIDAVLADKSVKEKGDILIADADGCVVYDGGLTHIKGRGNGSWYTHKKPFNLKLTEEAELLGKGASREWCLINQEFDLSCLRNKIAYDLAADAGVAYSPDSEFADLWIDGQYFGLYLLTDRIGVSEASVDITDLEKATEAVNLEELKTYPAGSAIPVEGGTSNVRYYMDIPNDPEDITGGYLLEVDKFYAKHKTSYFNTGRVFSVTIKAPEYASKAQVEYIYNYITEMETAVCTPGSLAYQNYIDLDSWVHMCVLEEILADSDYMGSSQYFYKEADPEGGRAPLYAGPIWDKDLSLGNSNSSSYILPNILLAPSRTWIKDLYSRPEFYEQMVAVYRDVYRPLAAELLEGGVDAYAAQTEASAKMNYTRWAPAFAGQPASFREDDVEEIKDFISARVELLDDLWINGAVYHSALVTTNKGVAQYEDMYYTLDYMVPDGEPLGEVLRKPQEKDGYKFVGWFYGTPTNPGAPYDPAAPLTEDVRIYAKWEETTP